MADAVKRTNTDSQESDVQEALEDLGNWVAMNRPIIPVGTGSILVIKRAIESLQAEVELLRRYLPEGFGTSPLPNPDLP